MRKGCNRWGDFRDEISQNGLFHSQNWKKLTSRIFEVSFSGSVGQRYMVVGMRKFWAKSRRNGIFEAKSRKSFFTHFLMFCSVFCSQRLKVLFQRTDGFHLICRENFTKNHNEISKIPGKTFSGIFVIKHANSASFRGTYRLLYNPPHWRTETQNEISKNAQKDSAILDM